VRIVDMHPVERADGVVILGELLNEDVVPAYVSVTQPCCLKNQSPIATEGSFDKISHLLLPKQVTPFLIVSQCNVVRSRQHSHDPTSTLVAASADPVIEIEDRAVESGSGSLVDRAAHQSERPDRERRACSWNVLRQGRPSGLGRRRVYRPALLPQTPVPFEIHIPEDLASKVSSQRTVVATYSSGGSQ
jgi:hypothetical protein